jgi:tetratricopeptide (TPR) repeat protein
MSPAKSLEAPLEDDQHGRDPDGVATLWDSLDWHSDLFGPHHPRTLAAAHQLAIALWDRGDVQGAIVLLHEALDCIASAFGSQDPLRVNFLGTLGAIMFEQRDLEQAGAINREVLEHHIRLSGANHPAALAAKSDLAAVLFELGQDEEAGLLELEAFESARTHLGKTHSVTCVLAWNRALNCERRGDPDAARSVLLEELVWLLAEDPAGLETDQNAVRTLLAERFHWNAARAC